MHYPVFLSLEDKPVLIAGAGKVALRKARGLVASGARITVVAPESLPEFARLPVRLLKRKFRPADLDGAALAFAATNRRQTNAAIARAARRRGIPVNVADCAAECDFLLPARIVRGALQVAVSTGGRSPRLAVAVRQKIESALASVLL